MRGCWRVWTMSSATSTDRSTFRLWHFFVLGALIAATAGVLLSSNTTPAAIILTSLAIGAAALVGLGVLRTLWPLVADDFDEIEVVSRRTREAVEREKALVLRTIKELEFDRAMGKVSAEDFEDMATRLRARAIGFMRQLDTDTSGYRDLIERELRTRLAAQPSGAAPVGGSGPVCRACETTNGADARFCKQCGASLA